ncbi:hypothetical protein SLE2022_011620 [Rubroshorea leprosula]
MLKFPMLWLLVFSLSPFSSSARPAPYAMRISCGARDDVHTPPTYTLWYRDFGYTGGIPYNASRPSDIITPPLKTLRYFPLSEGPENCYNFQNVPRGHYSVRIFFGLVPDSDFDNEPLFDISIESTLIYSMKSGWTKQEDQAFTEALVFLSDGTASICFHSTGHGDPAILSIEILQVDDKAYYFVQGWSEGLILRTAARLTFGISKPWFDEDYRGDHWGGDRYWSPIRNNADHTLATGHRIKQASDAPNFYPEALYQTALVGSDSQPGLTYTMDVDPNRKYSIWLHFAEIDDRVTGIGQRVFDISINGHPEFQDIDVVKMSGDRYTALVLNTTVAVNGRTLSINLQPKNGGSAIINAIEVFEIIVSEFKTLPEEVSALQALKSALGLPHHFGWNGDPCVPQEHPWSGADCHLNTTTNKWFIDGLDLDNRGLRGFLPTDISNLHHLQSINLSGNNIHGAIPSSLGTLTSLELLDLSYNSLNGSIPESLGQLTALRRLNLNSNSLSGRVPAALGGRLLHGASFNFTDNAGLCGIPGLRPCGPHLSASAKIGIGFAVSLCFLLLVICSMCWWKRRQNILRAQMIAARGAPYAKARTHLSHDIQLSRHQNHGHSRTAVENGPSLLS